MTMCENISTKWKNKAPQNFTLLHRKESDTTEWLNWTELKISWTVTVSSSVDTCKLRKKKNNNNKNKPLRNDSLGQMIKGHGTSSLKFSQMLLCLSTKIKCKIALKSPKPRYLPQSIQWLKSKAGAEGGGELAPGPRVVKDLVTRPEDLPTTTPVYSRPQGSDSKSRSLPTSAFLPFAQLPLPQFPRQRLWPRPTSGLPRPSFPP